MANFIKHVPVAMICDKFSGIFDWYYVFEFFSCSACSSCLDCDGGTVLVGSYPDFPLV